MSVFRWDAAINGWSQNSVAAQTTATDGRFTISGLAAGHYTIQYSGFYHTGYLTTWWGRHLSEDAAESFEIGVDDPPLDASMQLLLGGTISGCVTRLDGMAIPGAQIFAYRNGQQGWSLGATADEQGNYAIIGLHPGSYVVNFTGPWRSPWIDMWWQAGNRRSEATALTIEPGTVIGDIDAELAAPSAISGRLTDPDGHPLVGFGVSAHFRQDDVPGGWNYSPSRDTNSNGQFTIPGLRAGEFRLSISPPWTGDPKYPSQWWPGTTVEAEAVVFDVPVEGNVQLGGMTALKLIPVRSTMMIGRQVPVRVPVVGETLEALVMVDSGVAPERSYQWFRDGAPIGGAIDSSYVVDATDMGGRLSAQAVLSGPGLVSKTVQLQETAPVQQGTFTSVGSLHLQGSSYGVGSVLSVLGGQWEPQPSEVHYQWRRAGRDLIGQTSSTHTITSADRGGQLSVIVRVARPGFVPVEEVLAAGVACYDESALPRPTIGGIRAVGSTLSVSAGSTPAGVALGYQWQADGVQLVGETRSNLRLGKALLGKRVAAIVTGTLPGCPRITQSVEGTAPRTALAATPKISGTAKLRATLKVRRGTWTSKTKFSYRWYANGKAIPKATKSILKVGKSLKGRRITVMVTGKRSGYATVTKTSAGTRKVR